MELEIIKGSEIELKEVEWHCLNKQRLRVPTHAKVLGIGIASTELWTPQFAFGDNPQAP